MRNTVPEKRDRAEGETDYVRGGHLELNRLGNSWRTSSVWNPAGDGLQDEAPPSVAVRSLAEGERFELSVEVYPLRRFSKPLVSTTHPPLPKLLNLAVSLARAAKFM